MYIPLLSVAHGHPPPHCENTQVLREAITEDDDDEKSLDFIIDQMPHNALSDQGQNNLCLLTFVLPYNRFYSFLSLKNMKAVLLLWICLVARPCCCV